MNYKQIFLIVVLFLHAVLPVSAQYKEFRQVVFHASEPDGTHLLSPGEGVSQELSLPPSSIPMRNTLRVTGGILQPERYRKRGEELFRQAEFQLEDNLDSLIHWHDRRSLYFGGQGEDFPRQAFNRIALDGLSTVTLTLSIPVVKAQDLQVCPGGRFGVELQFYRHRQGRHHLDVYDAPDSLVFVPLPGGTYKKKIIEHAVQVPADMACVVLNIEALAFTGEVWVEAPSLLRGRDCFWHMPFAPHDMETREVNYWVGKNLSDRSWPMWQLELDGEVIFRGKVFDRASCVADFRMPLPSGQLNGRKLRLTLLREPHRQAFPYELRTLEVLQEPARPFEVIAVPPYVASGAAFGILLETNVPGQTLTAHTDSPAISPREQTVCFDEPGLHVLEFRAVQPAVDISLALSDGQRTEQVAVRQILCREGSPVYLSVGDDIYIDKNRSSYDPYFKWYLGCRAGNWMQFRPSYQWSGVRNIRPDVVRYYTQLMCQMQVPYAWQVEGRTLAGDSINPTVAQLESPMFRGKQAHENDGGYYYWGHFLYWGFFSDMAARTRPLGGIFAKHRPIFTDHGTFVHYDPKAVQDMADGACYFVQNLSSSRGESTRHTGPSTLFRYFYQAGYEWAGAEQMYGPEETVMSALRGASRAYNRPVYGSLHAMQWGTKDYNNPAHSLRHYMSLATAYMHGSSHLNTEDGLWTDEYLNDRYTPGGKMHMDVQHRMLDFIETHSRRGSLHTNIAVVQGRNCSWKCFGRGSMWSQNDPKWAFGRANESFDLLRVFYPDNYFDGCGPEHWFTHTPYGAVDILPIEASQEVLNGYRLLIFLGWNTFDAQDFQRLRLFVERGGTLVLTAAHLNTSLQPDVQPQPARDPVLTELLGPDYASLTELLVRDYGLGRVIFFPQAVYPSEPDLRAAYEDTMREQAARVNQPEPASGWIESGDGVSFTCWQGPDMRTLYVLHPRWQDSAPASFRLRLGGQSFPMQVEQGKLRPIYCANGVAISPEGNTTDVLRITPTLTGCVAVVQNTEPDELFIATASSSVPQRRSLPKAGIHTLEINFSAEQ